MVTVGASSKTWLMIYGHGTNGLWYTFVNTGPTYSFQTYEQPRQIWTEWVENGGDWRNCLRNKGIVLDRLVIAVYRNFLDGQGWHYMPMESRDYF